MKRILSYHSVNVCYKEFSCLLTFLNPHNSCSGHCSFWYIFHALFHFKVKQSVYLVYLSLHLSPSVFSSCHIISFSAVGDVTPFSLEDGVRAAPGLELFNTMTLKVLGTQDVAQRITLSFLLLSYAPSTL